MLVIPYRTFQDRIADLFCRLLLVFFNNSFDLLPVQLIAAIIDTVGIKEKDVSSAHQGDFRQVGGIHLTLAKLNGNIPAAVGMVLRNFKSERGELYHAALSDLHEPPIFCGEHKWGWMPEVYKAKESVRTYLAVHHGCDFTRTVF